MKICTNENIYIFYLYVCMYSLRQYLPIKDYGEKQSFCLGHEV